MKLEEAKMIFSKYFKDGPGKDFVMSVMDSIEYPMMIKAKDANAKGYEPGIIAGQQVEIVPLSKTEAPKKSKKTNKSCNEYPQKPKNKKVCESCGKEFYPNSGVQKLCLECRRQKEDISKTAWEMLDL